MIPALPTAETPQRHRPAATCAVQLFSARGPRLLRATVVLPDVATGPAQSGRPGTSLVKASFAFRHTDSGSASTGRLAAGSTGTDSRRRTSCAGSAPDHQAEGARSGPEFDVLSSGALGIPDRHFGTSARLGHQGLRPTVPSLICPDRSTQGAVNTAACGCDGRVQFRLA